LRNLRVKENEKLFHPLFKHKQNKRYSNYWFGYFSELLTSMACLSKQKLMVKLLKNPYQLY